ncbi:hypothetical protein EV426DRAFT_573672 [Tirmania nivea]|nr:hypothetical protein EV426DRAFT_573672 [Tirmania nivea]
MSFLLSPILWQADPAAVAKRRCVWVTEETNRRDSTCEANLADNSEHERSGYEMRTERRAEVQEKKNREEEERIWLEWQSADVDIEYRHSRAEVVACNSVFIGSSVPSAPRRSRKRSLTINTGGIVEDVALNSAGQEVNLDSFLPYSYPLPPNGCIGTGSFTWEKSLLDQISEGGEERNGRKVWDIIDPRLLAKTASGCGEA